MIKYYGLDYTETNEKLSNLIIAPEVDSIQGSGGGGSCFAYNTLIRTAKGYTPIQSIRESDLVISYDRFGNIEHGLVTQIYIHNKSEINLEDMYTFTVINSSEVIYTLPDCTGNHALYNANNNEHTEAKLFKIGDKLTDLMGEILTITSISITPFDSLPEDYEVYNFEVVPQHTYFVGDGTNWTRVHNGGGGKTASTSRTPIEDPNTLQSTAVARVLEILSEGPIDGLVGLSGSIIGQVFVPSPYTLVSINSYPIATTTLPTTDSSETTGLMAFSDTGLVTLTSCTKNTQSAYESYDAGCYSPNTLNGSIIVRWKVGATDKVQIVGLTSDISTFHTVNGQVTTSALAASSTAAFNTVNFGIVHNLDASYSIYEEGVHKGTSQVGTTKDTVFSIEYSATSVIYKRNSATVHTTTTTVGRALYFIALQASRGAIVNYIEIGQHVLGYLPNTLQGVYFNNTRIQNNDGTDNFYNVFVDIRLGLPDQTVIPGFTDVESVAQIDSVDILNGTSSVGIAPTTYVNGQTEDAIWEKVLGIYNAWSISVYGKPMDRAWDHDTDAKAAYQRLADQYLSIKAAETPGAAVPYIGTINELNIASAIVTLSFYEGLSSLIVATGDLHGDTLSLAIDTRTLPNGTFQEVLTKTITGKAVTSFEMDFRLRNPGSLTAGWAYRVRRTSPDPIGVTKKGIFKPIRVTQIVEQVEVYKNTAIVGITVSAEAVGNTIPTRGYDVKGLIIQVPSNYNTVLKTYAGTWDGTFKYAWTDNPAWCLYDLLVNKRYGVTSYLRNEISIDKWSFYTAAVYSDGLIPDGTTLLDGITPSGGMETRYTFNAIIQTQQDAWQLLHSVASTMRAEIALAGDTIVIIQDRPTLPSKVINNSNVLQGVFSYSTNSSTTRPTIVNTTFNEKSNNYLPRTISEQDNPGIAKYGFIPSDVLAYGVVTETAARRLAKWTLYTAMHQADQVAFSMSLNVVDLSVGDVISIMDNDFISSDTEFYSGRIVSSIDKTIIIDSPVILGAYGWTLAVNNITYDGIIEVPILESYGAYTSLTVTDTIIGDYTNHEYYIYKIGALVPRQFRISTIVESGRGVYTLSAIFYDPNKYNAIEYGITVDPPVYTKITTTVPTPTGLTISEGHTTNGVIDSSALTVSWDSNTQIDSYILGYRKNKDNFIYIEGLKDTIYILLDIISGTYEVTLQAVNIFKMKSKSITASYLYKLNISSTLLAPIDIFITGTTDTVFSSQDAAISWVYPPENDTKVDKLKEYIVEVYSADGLTMYNDYVINYNLSEPNYKGVITQYPKSQIQSDFGIAPREFQIKVYSRDITGSVSFPAVVNFTNPAPIALTDATLTGFDLNIIINLSACIIPSDAVEFVLAVSNTANFTPTKDTWYYKGIASQYHDGFNITSPTYGTFYIKATLVDNYSEDNLNWTPEYALVLSKGIAAGVFPVPHIPTNLIVTQTQGQQISGETFTTLRASWDASITPAVGLIPSILDKVSSYTLGVADIAITPLVYTYLDTSELFIQSSNILIGKTYKIKVRANLVDAHSLYTNEVTIIANGDTIAPNSPTNLQATSGFSTVTLTWDKPTTNTDSTICKDLKETEVWFCTTNSRNTATGITGLTNPILKTASNIATFPHLSKGMSGYFWVRAIDTTGNLSPFFPISTTSGILGSSSLIDSTDLTIALAKELLDTKEAAEAAIASLDIMLSDGILSIAELQNIRGYWEQIVAEKPTLYAPAIATYGLTIEPADYLASIQALGNFLKQGIWVSPEIPYYISDDYISTVTNTGLVIGTSSTAGILFRSTFKNYTTAKIALIQAMTNIAQGKATAATTAILHMADDNLLSPLEKSALRKEWDIIYNEKIIIDGQAVPAFVSTTTYDTAFTALANYLNNGATWVLGTTPPNWITTGNLSVETIIVADTFRLNFNSYYTARTSMIKDISDYAVKGLVNMLSDKNLSLPELQTIRGAWNAYVLEKSLLEAQCDTNNTPIVKTNYQNAFLALGNFLNTGKAAWTTGSPYTIIAIPYYISDSFISTITTTGFTIDDNTGITFRALYSTFLTTKAQIASVSLDTILNDNIISPSDKSIIRREWDSIIASHTTIVSSATTFGLVTPTASASYTSYINALTTLGTFLSNATWSIGAAIPYYISDGQLSIATNIDTKTGSIFRANTTAFYAARIALQKDITTNTATMSTAADTAKINGVPAATLTTDVASAKTNGAAAILGLNNILDDGIISLPELQAMRSYWDQVSAEKANIVSQGVTLTVSTTLYVSALQALGDFLNTGYTSQVWSTTVIPYYLTNSYIQSTGNVGFGAISSSTGIQLRAALKNFTDTRTSFFQAIATSASRKASFSGISGVPTNLANAGATPTASILNTDITLNGLTIVGIGAGDGSAIVNSGITLSSSGVLSGGGTSSAVTPAGIAAVATNLTNAPIGILNTQIYVNASGQLVNAGGGQVTLSGLGAGAFATVSQLSSANIASFIAASAIGSTQIGSVAATKITTGTLAAGVVYAGTINVSQINAGTLAANVIYSGTIDAGKITTGILNAITITGSQITGSNGIFSNPKYTIYRPDYTTSLIGTGGQYGGIFDGTQGGLYARSATWAITAENSVGSTALYAVGNIQATSSINASGGIYCYNGLTVLTGIINMPVGSLTCTNLRADNSDKLGGYTVAQLQAGLVSAVGTNSGIAYASAGAIYISGSAGTGIAGAYVGTSGAGAVVSLTVQTTSPSDSRIKHDIEDVTLGLNFVNKLRPVSYVLNADETNQKGFGFIAQEVQELLGDSTTSLSYFEKDREYGALQGINVVHYQSFIAPLVKAIQELSAKVNELETKLENIK